MSPLGESKTLVRTKYHHPYKQEWRSVLTLVGEGGECLMVVSWGVGRGGVVEPRQIEKMLNNYPLTRLQ